MPSKYVDHNEIDLRGGSPEPCHRAPALSSSIYKRYSQICDTTIPGEKASVSDDRVRTLTHPPYVHLNYLGQWTKSKEVAFSREKYKVLHLDPKWISREIHQQGLVLVNSKFSLNQWCEESSEKKKINSVFGFLNWSRRSRMEGDSSSSSNLPGILFSALSFDHKLEHVQKRERVDRTWNVYSGKDLGRKLLFLHV